LSFVRKLVPVFSQSRLYRGHSPGGLLAPDRSSATGPNVWLLRAQARRRTAAKPRSDADCGCRRLPTHP